MLTLVRLGLTNISIGYYLHFVGSINIFCLVATTFSYSFFITVPQYWLQLWTESGGKSSVFYILGFIFLSAMSWISTSVQMLSVLIKLSPQSGSRIHQRLLNVVACAPLSFFSKTENGSILNRFSQDIQLVDKQLPSALQTITVQIFKLLMQIIFLFVAQKWLALSLPVCVVLVYIIQGVYLRTSRQLRFLELESRANVFSSFLESVEGLETIRAFGWSEAVMQSNIQFVDNSQRPEFLLLCLQRWLNLVLDLLAAGIATGVVAAAVAFRGQISGAQVGIALNIMLVANTTLLKLVQSWTTLEISLGAIARLKTLEEMTPVEGGMTSTLDPPENWPSNGHIEFKKITASYQLETPTIRNLTLNVLAGQKLIVCGRTGSGKSTLLAILLRLLELQLGSIEIDGIDIKSVRLELIRQRCFIAVSQDPLILSNETLRFNLDPDNLVSDGIIIDALSIAGLWSHFSAVDTQSGETATTLDDSGFREHVVLDQRVSQFQELSVGQSQLFALCRALVKASLLRLSGVRPIVLLDEVTSSLDPDTESTIYRIIDNEFTQQGHTVIIVAHRLNVLTKYVKVGRDSVALMADGVLQEVIQDLNPSIFQHLRQIE
ncbi:hypothetical protein PVAG01_01970 [Phlyctema vagabunda]|uniref:Uncharacterized protein n=1 Tax=Phlyctema vagabunda TaxID=108571 RepID=A0ABR4PYP6_9HELO